MLEKILVPLDGSVTAEKILPSLWRFLRMRDAEVLLLGVALPPISEAALYSADAEIGAVREYLAGKKERLEEEGIRVRMIVRTGVPAGTILDVAEEEDVSLIALATHGRTGLERALMGSVAEQVVRKSPVPVFVVRPFWSYELLPPGRKELDAFRAILLPTDGSPRSMAALWPAIEVAKLYQARLVLLEVIEPPTAKTSPGKPTPKAVAQSLERFAETARSDGVETSIVVEEGDPVERIPKIAREQGCDMIAMTTHGRTGLGRLVVGSVTEQILRRSQLPLLIVRAKEETAKKVAEKAGKEKR